MWNFDETGFRIGIGKDQWIVTMSKKLFTQSNPNTEYVTLVGAVSAGGETNPPLIIRTGRVIMEGGLVLLRKEALLASMRLDISMTNWHIG
jgi:hypothetical protein